MKLIFKKDDKNNFNDKDDDIKGFEEFFDTNNFEVSCFCPLSTNLHVQIFNNNYKNENIDYFFVGGFDKENNKGIIKLYKIIYDKNIENIKIEFVEDIIIEDDQNKKFEKPISCIIQSRNNVLITCLDGNVYLFSKPNFELLERKNNIDYINL